MTQPESSLEEWLERSCLVCSLHQCYHVGIIIDLVSSEINFFLLLEVKECSIIVIGEWLSSILMPLERALDLAVVFERSTAQN